MRQMICGLTLFGLGSLCGSALALDPWIRELADDELLSSYWYCDRQARISAEAEERFDEALMQVCGGVSHELQRRRFDGDFAALHRWTEEHRAAAHSSPERGRHVPPDNPAPPSVRVRGFI
jgi:hypothetical protein